jgi:hypothetical protein
MKRIRTIKELNTEKKRLAQREVELEKAIKYDWRDLKDSLKPGHVAEEVFAGLFTGKEKQNGHTIFSDGVAGMAAKLARKLVEKAEGKIGKWFTK